MSLAYTAEQASRPSSYTSSGPIAAAPKASNSNFIRKAHPPRQAIYALQWYALSDALALAVGLFIAWGLVAYIGISSGLSFGLEDTALLALEFTVTGAIVLLWFQQTGHYHASMPFWIETRKIISTMFLAAMADGLLQLISKDPPSRLWLVTGWIIAAGVMLALRQSVRAYLKNQDRFYTPALLVGTGTTAQHVREALESDPCLTYRITAQIRDLPKTFLQTGKSWEALCALYGATYIIIALDGEELAAAAQPLAQLARESLPFSISLPFHQLPVMNMVPQYFMNHDVVLLAHRNKLQQSFPCFLKRTFDVAVSAMALAILSPLMLGLALWVKSDGGPAFYTHMRLGRNRRPFPCLKFRSMKLNGDEILKQHLAENPAARQEWESTQKLVDDPRITKVGKILRSTSLDELPQLINVLRGEMSLVGPRPIVNAEVTKYDSDFAHYCRVRPGITGLWQVSGRSDVSYPRRVHMDSWYVRNWSLWHDIAILCKTFPALLNRKGAY